MRVYFLAVVLAATVAVQPIPGINNVTAPLTKSGTTAGIRASSSSQSGYMSAVQASDLQYVLNFVGSPTPTPTPSDPLEFTGGSIFSQGVPDTYVSDTFTRANSADISGTLTQTGQTWNLRNNSSGGGTAGAIGVTSNAAYRVNGNGTGILYAESSHADGYAEVTLNVDADSGLMVRFAPGANFNASTGIEFYYASTCLRFGTWETSTVSQVAAINCSVSFPMTIAVSYSGSSYEFFYNGVSQGTQTLATYSSQTQVGIVSGNQNGTARLVNFSVSTVPETTGLTFRGNRTGGSTYDDMTCGQNANSGNGGCEFALESGGILSVNGNIASTGTHVIAGYGISATNATQSASYAPAASGGLHVKLQPNSTHGVQIATSGSKATCNATEAGGSIILYCDPVTGGVAGACYLCLKDAADAYAWHAITVAP